MNEGQHYLQDFISNVVDNATTFLRALQGDLQPSTALELSRVHSLCCINNSRLRIVSKISDILQGILDNYVSGVPLDILIELTQSINEHITVYPADNISRHEVGYHPSSAKSSTWLQSLLADYNDEYWALHKIVEKAQQSVNDGSSFVPGPLDIGLDPSPRQISEQVAHATPHYWGMVETLQQAHGVLDSRFEFIDTNRRYNVSNVGQHLWRLFHQPDISPSFRYLQSKTKQDILDLLNSFTETRISIEQLDAFLFVQNHVKLCFQIGWIRKTVSAIPEGWEFCDEMLFDEQRPAKRRLARPPPGARDFEEWLVINQQQLDLMGCDRKITENELFQRSK